MCKRWVLRHSELVQCYTWNQVSGLPVLCHTLPCKLRYWIQVSKVNTYLLRTVSRGLRRLWNRTFYWDNFWIYFTAVVAHWSISLHNIRNVSVKMWKCVGRGWWICISYKSLLLLVQLSNMDPQSWLNKKPELPPPQSFSEELGGKKCHTCWHTCSSINFFCQSSINCSLSIRCLSNTSTEHSAVIS